MYVRHAAWLNAIPKEAEKPRRETHSEAFTEPPHLDEYEQHLIKLWREVGSISQGGMGVAPLVWSEIIAWANQFYAQEYVQYIPKKLGDWKTVEVPVVMKQLTIEDYELEIIMQLSREYCDEYHSATDPSRECPKEIFLDEVDAEAESSALFQGLKDLGFVFA